ALAVDTVSNRTVTVGKQEFITSRSFTLPLDIGSLAPGRYRLDVILAKKDIKDTPVAGYSVEFSKGLKAVAGGAGVASVYFWLECEEFEGNWNMQTNIKGYSGSGFRCAANKRALIQPDPIWRQANIPAEGQYNLWVRARRESIGSRRNIHCDRRIQAAVDEKRLAVTHESSGAEAKYTWEIAGEVQLTAGSHKISIYDAGTGYESVDAVLLTNDLMFSPMDQLEIELDQPFYAPEKAANITFNIADKKRDLQGLALMVDLVKEASDEAPIVVAQLRELPGYSVPVSFPVTDIRTGTYILRGRLHDKLGRQLYVAAKTFQRFDDLKLGGPIPQFRKEMFRDNRLLVDGKPFFPIGLWGPGWGGSLVEIGNLAKHGINAVWTTPSPEVINGLYQKGCYSVVSVSHYVRGNVADFERYKADLHNLKNCPGLLGYYVDEPSVIAYKVRTAQMLYALTKEYDPTHPVWLNFTSGDRNIPPYLDSCDIPGADPYPIRTPGIIADLELVSRTTDKMLAYNHSYKPVWMLIQAFGYRSAPEPTPEELRCMTYLAVTHKASGIFWFMWRTDDGTGLHQSDKLRQAILQMASELRTLSPILLSTEAVPSIKVLQPEENAHLLLKSYKGCLYLIVVNGKRDSLQLKLVIDKGEKYKTAKLLLGEGEVPIKGGTLSMELPPLEVRIYSLK
ncbi:MAG: hypothetical protein PHT33_00410, partial [bacterium]|nr:hypothetical protein [bacterium]